MIHLKICSKCGEEKELSEFYKDNHYTDGYSKMCKICKKEYVANLYCNKKEITYKTCNICNKTKPITEFHKNCKSPDGYQWRCKECIKQYQLNNKNDIKQNKRKWYLKNKEHVFNYVKKYQTTHVEQAHRWRSICWYRNHARNLENKKTYNHTHHDLNYKHNYIHDGYGLTLLNKSFDGCNRHHLHLERTDFAVCVPSWLHKLYPHKSTNWFNMNTINAIVLDYWINEDVYEF